MKTSLILKKKITLLFTVAVIIAAFTHNSYAQIPDEINAALTGEKNIPGNYATISAAITDLNTNGVGAGGVRFNIAAGYTETLTSRLNLMATGTSANPIIFRKSGAGANPLLTAYTGTATPGSATPDGMWSLKGCDYVTIDGIDFYDPNSTNPATMEYAIGLFKNTATDGAQYDTVKNCVITLSFANNETGTAPMVDGSVGILIINSTPTTATTPVTPTTAPGRNAFNKIFSNTIKKCNYGIVLSGYAASTPFTLGDTLNNIGGSSSGQGNTIKNFGGASSAANPAAGIRAINQWGINISYNILNSNDGGGSNHVTILRGIYAESGTSASASINYNTVSVKGGGTTSQVSAIENGIGSTAASNTININYNVIDSCNYSTATSATLYGIYNLATPSTLNINYNTVQNMTLNGGSVSTGVIYPINNGSASNIVNINSDTVRYIINGGTSANPKVITLSSPTGASSMSNNFIKKITRTSVSSGTQYIFHITDPANLTVNSNTVDSVSFTDTSSTGTIYGFYGVSSSTNITFNSNIIKNFSTPKNGNLYGIYENGSTGTKIIKFNSIHHFYTTPGGAGGATMYGIYMTPGTTIEIAGDTVYSLNSTGSTGGNAGGVYGIRIAGGTTNSIYKNKVYDLSSNSTNPVVSGFYIAGGTTNNIYNNFTGDLRAPFANSGTPITGIFVSGGTTDSIYYNTVYLNAASSGATFGSTALFANTTPTLLLRNNIFVNLSTPNGTGLVCAYRRSNTTLTTYHANSNNNDFYAGLPGTSNLIFYDGTNSDAIISAFKTRVSARDALSISENPAFVSTTGSSSNFLHINTSIATQIESGARNLTGITDDFDGNTRQGNPGYSGTGTNPDIGADEFAGTPAVNMSYVSSTTDQVSGAAYRGVNNQQIIRIKIVTSGAANPLSATLFTVNANGTTAIANINASTAKLYYTGTSTTFSTTTLFGTKTPTIADFTVTGTQSLSDGNNYFWLAYDVIAGATPGNVIDGECKNITVGSVRTPTVTAPAGNKTIVGTMSGTYNVGSGQTFPNFTTLTSAISDLNFRGVSGAVTFNLTNTTSTPYNVSNGETFPIIINQITGASNSNYIKIKPNTSAIINGTSDTSLIKLNGADYVSINGSNSGSTDRSLTIQYDGLTGAAVLIKSLGTGSGAVKDSVRNCNVLTGTRYGSTYGIQATGDDNDSLTIQNNYIYKARTGIYVNALTSGGSDDSLKIMGNTVGHQSDSSLSVGAVGIYTNFTNKSIISGNLVQNLISTSISGPAGISIGTFTNSEIYKNEITTIKYLGTAGYGARGLTITASASANSKIYNNVIKDVTADGDGSVILDFNPFGICITGTGSGYYFYYNSVSLSGNRQSNANSNAVAAGMIVDASITNLTILNNSFFVNMSSDNASPGFNYGFYSLAPNTAYTNINYNDYYAASTTPGVTNLVGYLGGNQSSIALWRTATGKDLQSFNSNPLYNSLTDLRPSSGSPLIGSGTPVTGIKKDFVDTTRSETAPSVGAFEKTSDLSGPDIVYSALFNTSLFSNRNFTAVVTDPSGVNFNTGTSPRVYYKKSTDDNAFIDNTNSTTGWKYFETTTGSSPSDFTIDYSLLYTGTPGVGDTIQYFVVAQDLQAVPLVSINSGVFYTVPSDVDLKDAFPVTGAINKYVITLSPLAGDYTVGLTAFNKASGKNVYFEIKTEKEIIDAPVFEKISGERGGREYENSEKITGYEKKEIEKSVAVPMENGKPYTGELYYEFNNLSETVNKGIDSPNGVFATITAAIANLNSRGVSAKVRFLLNDASYTTASGETFPINVTTYVGSSTANRVTLRPNTGVTTLVSGISGTSIFKLSGADYFIIDGSNNGSTTRNLTIIDSSTAASTTPLWIASLGTNAGSTHDTVRNCNLYAGSASALTYGIFIGGTSIGSAGADNDSLSVINNSISRAYNGIYVSGTSPVNDALSISGNDIGGMNDINSRITLNGMYFSNCINSSISKNHIRNVYQPVAGSPYYNYGIFISTGFVNSVIEKNTIDSVNYDGGDGGSGRGMYVSTGNASSNLTIANNVIYNILGDGYSGWTAGGGLAGILIDGTTGGVGVYYNSVNLSGQLIQDAPCASADIYFGNSVSAISLKNNVFVNSITNPTDPTSTAYNVFDEANNTIFTSINYNDYYPNSGAQGYVGSVGGADQINLTAWKAASGQDVNSKSIDPQFNSATNLIPLTGSPVFAAGTPVSGITKDILDTTRSVTAPGMGAYEKAIAEQGPTIVYTNLTDTNNNGSRVLNGFAFITDASGVNVTAGTKPRIYYKKSADNNSFGGNTSATNNWKYAEASNSSSPFNFTINTSLIYGGTASITPGTVIQYFVAAQDLASPVNVSSNPSQGFAGTSVSNITSAPLVPNQYIVYSASALSGDYNVGLTAFNKASGHSLYYQKSVRKTDRLIPSKESANRKKGKGNKDEINKNPNNNSDRNLSSGDSRDNKLTADANANFSGDFVKVNSEEEYYELFENGKPYSGSLFCSDAPLSGAYATLGAAASDVSRAGVSGAVRFLLTDANYTGETLPVTFDSIPGTSAAFTVTVKPAAGVTTAISGSANNDAILKIYRSNYVIIDGSNTNGGNTKDMTLQNNSVTNPSVIWIGASRTRTNTDITVKNVKVINGSQYSNPVIVSDGQTAGDSIRTGAVLRKITFDNVEVTRGYTGMYFRGGSTNLRPLRNITVQNCITNPSGTDTLRYTGIYMQDVDTILIKGNEIQRIINDDVNAVTNYRPGAIWLASSCKNAVIEKNKLHDIAYTGGSEWGAYGIGISSEITGANITLRNNIIYNISCDGNSGIADWCHGIYAYSTQSGINIYNNSINLYGDDITNASANTSGMTFGAGTTVVDCRNNSIANSLGGLGLGAYALYAETGTSQFSGIDNNVYYTNSISTNYVGYLGAPYSTLVSFKTASLGDFGSYSGNPVYISNTNLLPDSTNASCWILYKKGIALATVPEDYRGLSRSTAVTGGETCIGAYEFITTTITPDATPSGSPVPGAATSYSFNGRTIMDIKWIGSPEPFLNRAYNSNKYNNSDVNSETDNVPSNVIVKYWSGITPPDTATGAAKNIGKGFWYLQFNTAVDSSNITIYYGAQELGNISSEADLILAKYDSATRVWVPFTRYTGGDSTGRSVVNTALKTIHVRQGQAGNASGVYTLTSNTNPIKRLRFDITAIMSGYYYDHGSGNPTQISDTLSITLRDTASPYNSLGNFRVVIDTIGRGNLLTTGLNTGNTYYAQINQLNSLETWTKIWTMPVTTGRKIYDMTSAQTQAYGDNLLQISGKWCLIGGDVNQDNYIDGSDYLEIINYYDTSEHLSGDTNGDIYIDGSDYLEVINHYDMGSIIPSTPMEKRTKQLLNRQIKQIKKAVEQKKIDEKNGVKSTAP